jgi:nicotinate-nucleotide--dimethylbenzimidazole phosphoribosyltransferase
VRARVVVAAADRDGARAGSQTLRGPSPLTALAAQVGADVVLVDAGVRDAPETEGVERLGLQPARDMVSECSLTIGEVALAVDAGRALAARAAADGITVLAGGEMGIADTTPAIALASWLIGELAGPDPEGVIEHSLTLHAEAARGPLGALRRFGDGGTCVLTGLALGAGEQGLGFVCDGLTTTAAAAIAVAVEPDLRPRLLAGHLSPEPAHAALLDHLGLEPVLDLGMRLGDGSGATAALAVLHLSAALLAASP